MEDIQGAYLHRTSSWRWKDPLRSLDPSSWRMFRKSYQVFQGPDTQAMTYIPYGGLLLPFFFPRRGYGPELTCRVSDGHPLVGLAGLGAQRGPGSLRDWPCSKAMLCGEWGAWSVHSHHFPLTIFQELCAFYFMVLLDGWNIKTEAFWDTGPPNSTFLMEINGCLL